MHSKQKVIKILIKFLKLTNFLSLQKIVDEFPKQLEDETEQKTFEDPLQNAVESGRLWKFADMNERIKDIDKKLESLTAFDYDHYDGKERTDSNSKEEH